MVHVVCPVVVLALLCHIWTYHTHWSTHTLYHRGCTHHHHFSHHRRQVSPSRQVLEAPVVECYQSPPQMHHLQLCSQRADMLPVGSVGGHTTLEPGCIQHAYQHRCGNTPEVTNGKLSMMHLFGDSKVGGVGYNGGSIEPAWELSPDEGRGV